MPAGTGAVHPADPRHGSGTVDRGECRRDPVSVDEIIELFDIADVNHSAYSSNPEKLLWLNQQHIIATPAKNLGEAQMLFLL
jgi:glutamyl/glutaminyl-tRNA synthetase